MRTRAPLLLLLLTLPVVTSCSLALTRQGLSVPDAPAGAVTVAPNANQCNPSSTWGAVDIALALASMSSGYLEAYGRLEPGQARGRYIWVGAAVGLGFIASGSVGFKRAEACRDRRRLRNLEQGFMDDSALPEVTEFRVDPNLITAAEAMEFADGSIYEAILRLRPQWLRRTGFRDDRPAVFVDNQPDELQILETMRPNEIHTLQFISPTDATIRFGTGYPSGVIEVQTRR